MDEVTVLVPSFKPTDRLIGTLQSLASQTYPHLRVHLSIDYAPGHPLPPLPGVPRLEIIPQSRRLGWVGNVNSLLSTVETPFFLIISHDDTLTRSYIQAAMDTLARFPDAVAAHGASRHHVGDRQWHLATESITGTPLERVMEFLRRGPDRAEQAWRGVVRSSAIACGLRLRTRRSDGQFSNTLWVLELLLYGETRAFEGEYSDRWIGPTGLSRVFIGRSADEKSAMLADNVACLVDVVKKATFAPSDEERVVAGYVQWLLDLQGDWNIVSEEQTSDPVPYAEVRPALARFVARAMLALAHGETPDAAPAPGQGSVSGRWRRPGEPA
jgi:glycosyl transferase family 2